MANIKNLQMRKTINSILEAQAKSDGKDSTEFVEDQQIGDNIRWAMRMSDITNFEANDTVPVNYHTSTFLKEVRDRLMVSLKKVFPQYASVIAPNSARVQTNAPIKLTPKVELNLHTYSDKGKIRLNLEMKIFGNCENTQYTTVLQYIEQRQQTAQFQVINEKYEQTVNKFSQKRTECYVSHSLLDIPFTYYKDHYLMLRFGVLFPTTEDFVEPQVLADMTEMVCAMLTARQKMDEILGN